MISNKARSCKPSLAATRMRQTACGEYVVQRGDTVVQIAQTFGTLTSNVVTQAHQYPDPYKLYPGQKLMILERDSNAPTQHRIVAGETLDIIAQQHGVPLQALQAANPDAHPVKLVPGTLLRLPNGGRYITSKSNWKQRRLTLDNTSAGTNAS